MKKYRNRWERGQEIKEKVPLSDLFVCGVIVGFTMGEGSFHIGISKSKTIKVGFQLMPRFCNRQVKMDTFC